MAVPLVQEISYQDPYQVFSYFSREEGAIFLDSAELRAQCGRYSFVAIDPFQILSCKNGMLNKNGLVLQGNPFEIIQQEIQAFSLETLPHLPPFQGGLAGYWGYELAQYLENIPLAARDDMKFPDLVLGFYDLLLAFDQVAQKAWIFSSGFPVGQERERQKRAKERMKSLENQLKAIAAERFEHIADVESMPKNRIEVTSNFSREAYLDLVRKAKSYILAGDIFEVNLSQCFKVSMTENFSAFELYSRLRRINSAPFAAYLNFSDFVLASASPERFLKVNGRLVETRPIKGTAPRGMSEEEDERRSLALLASEKDRSENIMIVDLLRNDLSRVCENHSVQVAKLCGLESYATVHHLVSVITGQLRSNLTALDLLKASFPGGSITGAPKCRAMEIIAELEPTARGPYCGSIGYLGFDGNMDSSIAIRTFCIRNKIITFQAGGAVVADSCPEQEYDEALLKAKALFRVLGREDDFTH